MKLKKLAVRNFRGLQNISVEFDNVANVIVGPNAVGKTTILEAVRLAKAVLSPRVPDEAQNALHTLGVFSPHNPQKLNLAAICGIEGEPLNITAVFELSSAEASSLDTLIPDLATAGPLWVGATPPDSFPSYSFFRLPTAGRRWQRLVYRSQANFPQFRDDRQSRLI